MVTGNIFHYISGNKPQAGKETVRRENVLCILQHREKDSFAILKRRNIDFISLVMGGVDNENLIDAGLREIAEETGYINVAYEHTLPGEIHAEYYAAHKDINRYSVERCVVYKLLGNETHGKALEDEHHELHWVPKAEVASHLTNIPGVISHAAFWYYYTQQWDTYHQYVSKMKLLS